MSREYTRIYYPQSLHTLDPQPVIHNLAHTRSPNQMILRRDMVSQNLDAILLRLQTHFRSRLYPFSQGF
jgi:hypothetical protein